MTWGRGFFRAWLVLSAIWIGLSVYINEPKSYASLWRGPLFDFATPSGRAVTLDGSKSREELAADITEELRREAGKAAGLPPGFVLEQTPKSLSEKRDELLAFIDAKRENASEEAKRAWLVTFIPPFGLLGLGLSIAWILRGFRARKSTST